MELLKQNGWGGGRGTKLPNTWADHEKVVKTTTTSYGSWVKRFSGPEEEEEEKEEEEKQDPFQQDHVEVTDLLELFNRSVTPPLPSDFD